MRPGSRTFFRISNADGKTWLLPARGMRVGLELYQPSGIKGKMLKNLFPLLYHLPPVCRAIHAEKVRATLDPLLLDKAAAAFGVTPAKLHYSIFGGTPSVHRKITIQFFDTSGHILGYGKVTRSQKVGALFEHEHRLLDALDAQGVGNIPKCLYCGDMGSGMKFFVQSTIKERGAKSPARYTPKHEAFLRSLTERTLRSLPFEDTDYARTLSELESVAGRLPEDCRPTVMEALESVLASSRGRIVEGAACHSDFTPWNMFESGDGLYVFDWEYGRMTYPPMLDRYHFIVQQAWHVEHLDAGAIMERLREQKWFDAADLRKYLLDIISRRTAREPGALPAELTRDIRLWTALLEMAREDIRHQA